MSRGCALYGDSCYSFSVVVFQSAGVSYVMVGLVLDPGFVPWSLVGGTFVRWAGRGVALGGS